MIVDTKLGRTQTSTTVKRELCCKELTGVTCADSGTLHGRSQALVLIGFVCFIVGRAVQAQEPVIRQNIWHH